MGNFRTNSDAGFCSEHRPCEFAEFSVPAGPSACLRLPVEADLLWDARRSAAFSKTRALCGKGIRELRFMYVKFKVHIRLHVLPSQSWLNEFFD